MILIFLIISSQACTLLDGQQPSKPKPSLTKCYKYNTNACCVSAHDANILTDYGNMLSSQCQREYDYLEDYFCFGCNPGQFQYVNTNNNTIFVCRGYAETLWGGSLLLPTSQFDNCGMTSFWRQDGSSSTIVPSNEWSNAFQFFWEVKPTYFHDYTIVIVDNSWNCYSQAFLLSISAIYLSL